MRWVSKIVFKRLLWEYWLFYRCAISVYSLLESRSPRRKSHLRAGIAVVIQVRNKHLGQLMADSAVKQMKWRSRCFILKDYCELTASAKTRLLFVPRAPVVTVYHHTDTRTKAGSVRFGFVSRYDIELSTQHPATTAPDQEDARIQRQQGLLVSLQPVFQGVLQSILKSRWLCNGSGDSRNRYANGVDLCTLETGIHVAYPGKEHTVRSTISKTTMVPR